MRFNIYLRTKLISKLSYNNILSILEWGESRYKWVAESRYKWVAEGRGITSTHRGRIWGRGISSPICIMIVNFYKTISLTSLKMTEHNEAE